MKQRNSHGDGQARPGDFQRVGDNVVIEVREEFLDHPHEQEFALERPLRGYRIQRVGRAVAAGIIVLGMVLLSAFGVMSLLNAALLATAALLITGCITFRRAWRSIDWQTYVVLAAAVGLEPAITGSGLADEIADGLNELAGGNTFRYSFTGQFDTGLLTITFIAGSWRDIAVDAAGNGEWAVAIRSAEIDSVDLVNGDALIAGVLGGAEPGLPPRLDRAEPAAHGDGDDREGRRRPAPHLPRRPPLPVPHPRSPHRHHPLPRPCGESAIAPKDRPPAIS